MNNQTIKKHRLHNIRINPALNDGLHGLLRIEASQWVTDARGNVTDIGHRLEEETIAQALDELYRRAEIIVREFHIELKPIKI